MEWDSERDLSHILKLLGEFSNIDRKKSIVFIYTSNEQLYLKYNAIYNDIKNIQWYISENMCQDLCTEDYKIVLRKIREDL